MLKLLIAEDEKLERDAIHFLVKKHFPTTFCEIFEAKNGEEAVVIALKENPDLIFMDIEMPLKNGLDAAKDIRQKRPHISFIILTAFGTFDYAKKALKVPVKDYLLKPVSVNDFITCVNKVIEGIHMEKKKSSHLIHMEEQMKNFKPLVHKNLIHEIITGSPKTSQNVDYFQAYALDYNYYFCLVIQMDHDPDALQRSFYFINKKLNFDYKDVISECHLMKMIFFVFSDKTIPLPDVELGIRNALKLQHITSYNIGLSGVNEPHINLRDCYVEAKTKLFRAKETIPRDGLALAEINLYDTVINEDLKQGQIQIDQLLHKLSHYPINTRNLALEKLLQGLCKKISFYISKPYDLTYNRLLPNGLTIDEDIYIIQQQMYEILLGCITCIQDYRNCGDEKIVHSAITYINKHFTDYDISLNSVATSIHISPYYLSKLFKEVTGKNFKQHLIERRMDLAKDLLKEHCVKDVCNLIGYSDPNYFSRAFKKFTGLPPKNFMS